MIRLRSSPPSGTVPASRSKSYTHRLLVGAASLGLDLVVHRPLLSDDTLRTRHGLRRLGFPVLASPDRWSVGRRGAAGRRSGPVTIDCGESGTTLRFLAALAAREDRAVRLDGRPALLRRPMDDLSAPLRALGAEFSRPEGPRGAVRVRGPLRPGAARVRGDRSSQFTSGLMLSLAGLDAPSTLRRHGPRVSEPYVAATERVLRRLGAPVRSIPDGWELGGPRRRRAPTQVTVPGDASSAAFLLGAAAAAGGRVRVTGLDASWPQADLAIVGLLRSAGVAVVATREGLSAAGPLRRGFRIDLDRAPDLLPLAGALAAAAPTPSTILGARHARWKESDRRRGTVQLARALGARVIAGPGRIRIEPRRPPRPLGRFRATDHRMLAAAAVAALATEGTTLLGPGTAMRKSYPRFWRDLRALGLELRELA